MNVQSIPAIEDMTPAQKIELMEALWKNMSRNPDEIESPDWHRQVLEERERALAKGEIEFMDWDEAKAYIRKRTIDRAK